MSATPVFTWQLYDEISEKRRAGIDELIADITECWGDPLDWLPIYIAPQPKAPELQRQGYRPQNWSLPYLRRLHSLSKKTKGQLDTAHSCIFKVVSDRYESEGPFSNIAEFPHLMVEDMDAVEKELIIALNAHNSSVGNETMDTTTTQPSENPAEPAAEAPAEALTVAAPTDQEQDGETSDEDNRSSEEAKQNPSVEPATGPLGKSANTNADKGKKLGSGKQRAGEEVQKSRCIAAMSKAWVQPAEEWIPEDLLPYCKGAKTKKETDPKNWNVALLRNLRMLSNHTKDDLDLAQVFMNWQVRKKSGDKVRPLTGADFPKASELPDLLSELKAKIARRAELKKKKRKAESAQDQGERSRGTAEDSARPDGPAEASRVNDRRGSPAPMRSPATIRETSGNIRMPIGGSHCSPSGTGGGVEQAPSEGNASVAIHDMSQTKQRTGDATLHSESATTHSRDESSIGSGRAAERYQMPGKDFPLDAHHDERRSRSHDTLAISTGETGTVAGSRSINPHRTSSERAPLTTIDIDPRYESAAASSISRRVPSLRHDSHQPSRGNAQQHIMHDLAPAPSDPWTRHHSRIDHENGSQRTGTEERSSTYDLGHSDVGTAATSVTNRTANPTRYNALRTNDPESISLFSRPLRDELHESATPAPSKRRKISHGQGSLERSSDDGLITATSQYPGMYYAQQDRAARQYRFDPSRVGYAADTDMHDVVNDNLLRGVSRIKFDSSGRPVDTTHRRDSLWQDSRGSNDEYHSSRSEHLWEPCRHRAFAGANDDHYCNVPTSALMAEVKALKQALLEKHLQIQDLQDKAVRLEEQLSGKNRRLRG